MNVFVLLNTKEDILKNVGDSSSGAPLTSIVFIFSYYGSQWCPKTAWLQTVLIFSMKTRTINIRLQTFFLWLRVEELKWISDDKNHDEM